MDKILLIKIGALGDVVRTTSLLHALKGEITWVTKKNAFPLLAKNPKIAHTLDIAQSFKTVLNNDYRLVVNLDEDPMACELAAKAKKQELIGAYSEAGKITYTDSAAPWFDMGLISKYGKKAADQKKWENNKSYQEIIYGMLGKKFNGEEYILAADPKSPVKGKEMVGLETRSGDRWVGKRWTRFPELMDILNREKIKSLKFRAFPTLQGFVRHINQADLVVTTDSLALHIALGLKKKVAALFTCTSFHEIYPYGRMEKIVSPAIEKYYYNATEEALKSGEAIAPEKVFEVLKKLKSSVIPAQAGIHVHGGGIERKEAGGNF